MKTKLTAMLLAAGAIASTAMALTEEVGGITWTYTVNDSKAEICDGLNAAIPTTTAGAIDVPSTLGGYPVTRIGDYAFESCPLLTRIKIPSGVTSIGNFVFHSSTALRDLSIPKTVEVLGVNAFLTSSIEVIHVEDGDVDRVRTLVSGVSSGTYTYVVGFPENDDFANAAELLGSSGSVNASNVGASTEANEPLVAAFAGEYTAPGATEWWTWTAPSDCLAFFDTVGSAFDTVLGVYTGDSLQALTTVATNDDNVSLAFPNRSKVSFVAVSGQSYRIAVGGHQYLNTGDVVLNWNTFDIPDYASILGAPASMTFTPSGDKPWVAGGAVDGKTAVKSGLETTDDGKKSTLVATFSGAGKLSFYYRVSSEENYDKLGLYIDGENVFFKSGTVPWTKYEVELSAGDHEVVWTYSKDGNNFDGDDTAWIAEVGFVRQYTVTFNANGGSVDEASRQIYDGSAVGVLPDATHTGYTQNGWWTLADGGSEVTAATSVNADMEIFAHWTPNQYPEPQPEPESQPEAPTEQVLYSVVADVVDVNEASTWDGFLRSASGGVAGTFLAKVGKAGNNGKPSKVTLTLQPAGERALKYTGTMDASGRFTAAGGVELVFGADAVKGTVGGYRIDGSRSPFVSKRAADKIAANAILVGRKQVYPVAWKDGGGWSSLTVTVAAKGKAKATGVLANGTKVSANGQLLHGDGVDCVVVVSTKKDAPIVFAMWFTADGIVVEGLGDDAIAAKGVSNVPNGASVTCALLAAPAPVTVAGKKWTVATDKDTAMKLTYTAKSGTFKGSFKLGKAKATVNGVVVDGKGYGSAVIKGEGSTEVTVEACNTCTR